jgi:hypothetical protein
MTNIFTYTQILHKLGGIDSVQMKSYMDALKSTQWLKLVDHSSGRVESADIAKLVELEDIAEGITQVML